MINILICGWGNIGQHIYNEFKNMQDACFYVYDKYKRLDERENNKIVTLQDLTLLDYYTFDYAFICVPTESKEDGSANLTEVLYCVNNIHAQYIIIKSAVPVGTWFSLDNKSIVISPEFYGTTQHSLDSPNFVILGGYSEATNAVAALYQKVKNGEFHYYFTNARTAELVKYMSNCWIATKVTFCNEFASIAQQYDINYNELRGMFIADERVSPWHTYVYQDTPYYDSHCLNKDIPALIAQCDKDNIETPLMDNVHKINLERKGENNETKILNNNSSI